MATPTSPGNRPEAEGLTRVIDSLRFRDEMAIIAAPAPSRSSPCTGLTGHQRTLRNALDAIRPSDGPTHITEAVELARRILGGNRQGTSILVLTDATFPDSGKLLEAPDLDAFVVGKATAATSRSAALYQVHRRSLLDPIGYEILVEVANLSETPAECRLELDLDGEVVDVVPLKIEPGGKWTKVIEKMSAVGGRLTARLNKSDALLADNQAWAILPKREPRPVTLVTAGNLFLEKVIQAIPLVRLDVAKELPKTLDGSSVLLLHKIVPQVLPAGPVLVVDPAGPCDLWDLGEPLQNPIVTKQDKESPILAHVRLDNVSMPEARQIKPKGSAPVQVLASSLCRRASDCRVRPT